MSPGVHLILTRLRAPILALGAVSLVGVLGYRLLEGWSWLDAAWMVAITLTTIGYGEVHPLSPAGRLFTMALIGVGVGVATWALGQAAGYALSGDLQREFEAARQEQRLEALKGHMVVAGYGRTGQEVAADLAHAGVVVVVIDPDPQACGAARAAGHLAVHGDATSDAILRTAGVERAVGLAATSASDAVNVFVVLSARQFSASLRILARVDHAENEAKARHAGADGVVRPHAIGGTTLANGLLRPGAAAFVEQALARGYRDLAVEDVRVHAAGYVGRVDALRLRERHGVLVVAIQRADGAFSTLPGPDAHVHDGDTLVVMGRPPDVEALRSAAAGQKVST